MPKRKATKRKTAKRKAPKKVASSDWLRKALGKRSLPAKDGIAWCTQMMKRDCIGLVCDARLTALRRELEASDLT